MKNKESWQVMQEREAKRNKEGYGKLGGEQAKLALNHARN